MKESNRQRSFSKLVQKELSEIFQRDFKAPDAQFVTVTVVRVSTDLGVAKIYLSAFPDESVSSTVLYMNEKMKDIRKLLGARIAKQVRHIPELQFYADDTTQYAANIDRLLKKIKDENSGLS